MDEPIKTEVIEETPTQTPEEIRAAGNESLQGAIDSMVAQREANVVSQVVEALNTASARVTPEQENVRRAIAAADPKPKSEGRASSSVPSFAEFSRTRMPDQFADWRYSTLPQWQREMRNPNDDLIVDRYFRALHQRSYHNDSTLMRQVMDYDKMCRADILVGATGGTDGVFDGTGGELLPLPVANFLNVAVYKMARFRSITRNFTATTGKSLRIPLQSTISNSTWIAEAAASIAGEPTVQDHLNLDLRKLTTLARLSAEEIEDEAFGVVQWLVNDVAMEMAEEEDEKLYGSGGGVGSLEPRGLEAEDVVADAQFTTPVYLVPGTGQAADYNATCTIDIAHVNKMFYTLPEKERATAVWAGPDSVMEVLSNLTDANGRPMFQNSDLPAGVVGDSAAGAGIGSMLRRPVFNLPGASGGPAVDATTDRLYFFNPQRTYATLDKEGVRVTSSTDVDFVTDKTVFKFIRRVDGGVIGNNIAGRFQYVFTPGITGVTP